MAGNCLVETDLGVLVESQLSMSQHCAQVANFTMSSVKQEVQQAVINLFSFPLVTEFNVTCRYGGVFHVEKNGRYSLTRAEAVELCRALNSTLATLEQVKKANELGFETCRYGFVVGHVVIPRVKPYHLCAANHTGVYILLTNTTGRYDAYCYNETETRNKTCDPVERLDTSFLTTQDEIVIDNADGSRYNPDGTRHGGETSGADDDSVGSGSTHDTTPMDTSIRRSSPSYYGSATPASQLPDHSSGGGEKEIPVRYSGDEVSPVSSAFPLVTETDDSPSRAAGPYPASTTALAHRDDLEQATTQAWWNPFSNHWWWSSPGEKTQGPTQATKADGTSSGNGSDDEDSSEEVSYPTVFPGWDRNVVKDEHAPSTTALAHRDDLEQATTQAWWNPFSNHWWWSSPGEKTQGPTQATKADGTSSGNGSDDEDSSEEVSYPTVFPGWDRSVVKDEHAPSTTVDLQHGRLLEISSPDPWNPAYTDEEEQYPSSAGRALVTSQHEKHQGPTPPPLLHSAHSGGGSSQEQAPASTTGSIQQQEFAAAGENGTEKESSATAVASSHGAKHNGSAQAPVVYPGWEQGEDDATQTAVMDRIVPSRDTNQDKESSTKVASAAGAHHEDPTQPPLPSDTEPGQGTEGIVHPTAIPGNELLHTTTASRGTAGEEPPLMGTISQSMDDVNPEGATTEPVAPGTLPGGESQEANSTEDSHGSWIPALFPDTEDDLSQLQTPLPTIASAAGAHHEDPTQPPLPSDTEPGQGTEGIVHPTAIPGNGLLHTTTASRGTAGEEPPLMGTISQSMDDVNPEEATTEPVAPGTLPGGESQEANSTEDSHGSWIPALFPDTEDDLSQLQTPLPTIASAAGAHHEDPTQPPLPSDTEPGQGTEGIVHPTAIPGNELLHTTTASRGTAGEEPPLMGTISQSMDDVNPEGATTEPVAPGTLPGGESQEANSTEDSHGSWIPALFPDTEDDLSQLQTPLPTRSTSSNHGNQGPRKGYSDSTASPGETTTTTTILSQPRSAQVPEWLIIVAALLALALILAVCIAVNSRRRCGQKKKLVINNGKGAVEDRKTSGLNGDASTSQEMVHLVHKEQSNDRTGACDEFLTVNETQNHQELAMKSGV
ncbi:CD44 antigen [Melanerpes formicivorus]|uniref:CD44 antigen n=1 Tax=Melanerpes formicivorus TaxID=211600 RepID=UPI00358FC517